MDSEPERGGPDASLQAAFQRLLDPGSLGQGGRWLHHNQKLIASEESRVSWRGEDERDV